MAEVGERPVEPPRRDARRNRGRLLAAARAVVAERGVDASLDLIVGRAGVGIGTLYRHFPRRGELVDAIFDERAEEVAAAIETALARPDAPAALERFLPVMVDLERAIASSRSSSPATRPTSASSRGCATASSAPASSCSSEPRGRGARRLHARRPSLPVWSLGPAPRPRVDAVAEALRAPPVAV